MKKLIIVLIIIGAFIHYKKINVPAVLGFKQSQIEYSAPSKTYSCDGREYCSQMTSCEEATYFLDNCPNTKMDGNNDGVPCEKQWC